MSVLAFEVTFVTPYAVGQEVKIPGSTIKGLMLDTARDLSIPWALIREVFGGHRIDIAEIDSTEEDPASQKSGPTLPSPWAWSDMEFPDGEPNETSRSRIRINKVTGVVTDGALVLSKEYHIQGIHKGSFSIERVGPVPRLCPPVSICEEKHLAILEATARAMTSLGGDRRRGLGWITVSRKDKQTTAAELAEAIEALRGKERADES
jgi:CRISPR/Cas system CSM-associated protein Csm3 (group 7 of RAMP superfamily)